MKLSAMEKFSMLWAPWFFGLVLTVCGIIVTKNDASRLSGIVMISAGLICMSIYSVCALLVRLLKK